MSSKLIKIDTSGTNASYDTHGINFYNGTTVKGHIGSSDAIMGIYGAGSIALRPGGAINNADKGIKLSTTAMLPESNVDLGGTSNYWKAAYLTDIYLSSATASQAVVTDANNKLVSREILDRTSISALTNASSWANSTSIPTVNLIAYWDGRYQTSSNKSNLKYCNKGEFGAAVTYAVDDATANGALGTGTGLTTERSVYYGLVTVNNASQTRATGIYAPTSGGAAGKILIGAGTTTAPVWAPAATLSGGTSTTANTAAYTDLNLGNTANVSTTTAHSEGRIFLYSAATNYHQIRGTSTTTNYTHYLPNSTGWVATGGNGTSTGVGDSDEPVYLSTGGVLTKGSVYAGGTAVTLNGTSKAASTASFYAPTSGGTANQVLVSAGDAAPTWKATASGAAYATSANGALTFGKLPIAQGGTNATTATTAANSLQVLSLLIGTSIANATNINTLIDPGTYYSASSTVSGTLTGEVLHTGSGFKLIVSRVYSNSRVDQFVQANDYILNYRYNNTASDDTTWTPWRRFATIQASTSDKKTFSAVGSTTNPVYVASNGTIAKCNSIVDIVYPIGSIYITTNATNPGASNGVFPGTTWVAFGKGRMLIGYDDAQGSTFGTGGAEGGSTTKSLIDVNLPSHQHLISSDKVSTNSTGSHQHGGYNDWVATTSGSSGRLTGKQTGSSNTSNPITQPAGDHSHTVSGVTDFTPAQGSGAVPFDVMNPYVVVYMWKRTA